MVDESSANVSERHVDDQELDVSEDQIEPSAGSEHAAEECERAADLEEGAPVSPQADEMASESAEAISASMLSGMNQALEASKAAEQSAKEQLVRLQAEMQNMRRRTDRDVENAHKFALEKFAQDLLPVFDSLERGLASVPEDDAAQQAAREGLVLTHKMLVDTLGRFKVVVVDPVGEAFDPDLHEAISMQPSDDVADNHVLQVFQKGFTLNGRLIRPAMVVVSKN